MATDEGTPAFIAPMLLGRGDGVPPRSRAWVLEPKWDGCRAQLRALDGAVTVRTRQGHDVTAAFPELAAIVDELPGCVILDGELVCLDARDGLPDFEMLRPRLTMSRASTIAAAVEERPVKLIVFDLLHLGSESTYLLPFGARRALLEGLQLRAPFWETTIATPASDHALVDLTRQRQMEGVVAKRLDSIYSPGRRVPTALKYKHRRRSRLAVSGWQPATRTRPEVFYLRWRDGESAGQIDRAVRPRVRDALRAAAAAATTSISRTGIHNLKSGSVLVDVDHHGRDGRPVRDASLVDLIGG